MKRLVLLSAVAAAVALVGAAGASASAPIEVTTSISPDWIYFADTVTARVDVVADRTQVDASSVQIAASFAPWEEARDPEVSTVETATTMQRTIVYTLRCIDVTCVPRGTVVQPFHLPAVTVTAESSSQASIVVRQPWPPVNVAGRFLPPETGAVRPQLVLETRAPSMRFDVSPNGGALAFDVAAGLLGLAAVGLASIEARRYAGRRRSRADDRPPLVRALDLIREARSRDAADRRRAVALLARLLPHHAAEQSAAAEIAWSKPDPSPEELERLADEVEASVVRRP